MSRTEIGQTFASDACTSLLASWKSEQELAAWAINARNSLLDSFAPEVQQTLRRKVLATESFVVLFGETQVGKTTLLLELMQVAAEYMPTVSKVLRGGRPAGQSATATAMEYRRHDGPDWGFTWSENSAVTHWFDTDAAITDALGAMRAQMEAGTTLPDTPCVVHIPARFFEPTSQSNAVRILDLPGDRPANAVEQKHVHAIAQRYIPAADLILLVGKADSLAFLQPGQIALPGLQNWQKMPHRFRIVTTFCTSPISVREFIAQHSKLTADELRQRLLLQITTFGGLSKAASSPALFYPLEIGESWAALRRDEPQLYHRLAPLMAKLRTQLWQDIKDSTNILGQVRNMWQTHVCIAAIHEEKLKIQKEQLAVARELYAAVLKEHRFVHRQHLIAKRDWMRLQIDCEHALPHADYIGIEPLANDIHPLPQLASNKHREVAVLKECIRQWEHAIFHMKVRVLLQPKTHPAPPKSYWKHIAKALKEPDTITRRAAIDRAFVQVAQRLDGYWIDSYFNSASFERDARDVHQAGIKAQDAVLAQWRDALGKAVVLVRQQLEQTTQRHASECAMLHYQTERLLHKQQNQQTIVEHATQTLAASEQAAQSDKRLCLQFVQRLEHHYHTQLEHQWQSIWEASTPSDMLLEVLSCVALRQQHRQVMSMQEFIEGQTEFSNNE